MRDVAFCGLRLFACLLTFISISSAASGDIRELTWVPGGSNLDWKNSANWSGPGGQYPDDPEDKAILPTKGGTPNPQLDGNLPDLGQLYFNAAGWTIEKLGDYTMNFNSVPYYNYNAIYSVGSGTNQIQPTIAFLNPGENVYTGSGNTLIIDKVGGSYAFIVSSLNPTTEDTGAIRLTGNNSTLTNAFLIRQGTLLVADSGALGTGSGTIYFGDDYSVNNAYTKLLTDAGGITISKNLEIRNISGHATNAILGGNQTSGASTFSGSITLGRDVVLTSANTDESAVSFTGAFSGSGGIRKLGPGKVILSGSLSYSGNTLVNAGTLHITSSSFTNGTNRWAYANSGATLRIDGTLTNNGYMNASNTGSLLDLRGSVTNNREIYSSSATVAFSNTLVNHGIVYATGGGSVTAGAAVTNYYDSGTDKIYATGSGSSVTLAGPVTNYGSIYAASSGLLTLSGAINTTSYGIIYATSDGTVNITSTATIKDNNTGEFRASGGTMNIAATIESGADNFFTAYSGVLSFNYANLNTGLFSLTDALRPRGGTITLASAGQTLANASGKTISGYGNLLETGRILSNSGVIEASTGTLSVRGIITNQDTMRAVGGATLNLEGTLTNDGQIYTSGASTVTLTDAAPTGSGYFQANTSGTIRLPAGFTNQYLSDAAALRLQGGSIVVGTLGASMTNALGKNISGYGTLLQAGQTLYNYGLLEPQGGSLAVGGDVVNYASTIIVNEGLSLSIGGTLTNQSGGLVDIDGGTLSAAAVAGGGVYHLKNAILISTQSFTLGVNAVLNDSDVPGSLIRTFGTVTNRAAGGAEFDVDQIRWEMLAGPRAVKDTQIIWSATDLGPKPEGLIDNKAVGLLVFGDGVGEPRSESFKLLEDSTIYTFGLVINEDALVDLGGRTIYYLREGVIVNGIPGQGFQCFGEYFNGQILEIVPEPSTWLLLGVAAALLAWRRKG